MRDLKSMTLEELELAVKELGEKKFRAKQIFEWFHKRLASSLDEMNNLPKNLKEKLQEKYEAAELKEVEKYLFQLNDGNMIESVLMKYKHGNSVCISSQAGCRMGCRFCASTLGGLDRNLLPSEMLGQIYYIQKDTGERVSNVVVMGTGEPLDNYENLLRFIRLLTDEKGLNLSQRNLTVSTCGLVPKIRELADEKLQMTLAISLHASNDEMRKSLMPVANQYSMEDLLAACKYYFDRTGRRITFEYSLVAEVNDSPQNAKELCRFLGGFPCHVNLIPVNPIKERDFRQSMPEFVNDFKNILEKNRVNVTIRREMGRDINAACGQLRRKKLNSVEKQEIRTKKEN